MDIWILLWTPHPAISHGRWLTSTFSLSPQQPVMEGDLPPQSPFLLVLLEGSSHDSLWFLLQIQRSKVKSSISATTNRLSTGMMKQPRWQQCGIGQERGPGCRLRALTKRGGSELADVFLGTWWPLGQCAILPPCCISHTPSLLPDVLPRPPSSIAWNATTARPMSMGPSATSMGGPGRPRFGWVLKEGSWYFLSDNSDFNGRGKVCILRS